MRDIFIQKEYIKNNLKKKKKKYYSLLLIPVYQATA